MKILVALAVLFSFSAFSQEISAGKSDRKHCYDKADGLKKKRFAEYECGKIAGVVDCNEKLEMDEASNTVLTASAKQPFSGTCETCHMNGLLERRVTFVNGKTNGIDTTKYATGCLMVIRNHVMGAPNGVWTYYYDSLEIPAWEMQYSVGELQGVQVYYDKKGDTTKLETYRNGVLNGAKVTYGPGNKRIKQTNYANGLLDGPFLIFNKDQKIIEELTYKQGKKNGVFKYYYDDGTLLRTENWFMDARNGEFKTFYYDQTLQSIEIYKKSSGKPDIQMDAETYVSPTKKIAEEVYAMLGRNMTVKQIKERLGEDAISEVISDKGVDPSQKPYLKGEKLERGLNKPYEADKKFSVLSSVPSS